MTGWYRTALAATILLIGLGTGPVVAQEVPTVRSIPPAQYPTAPAGWKVTCVISTGSGAPASACPVLQYNGYTYWAFSDVQNAVAMAIVAYDASGKAVKQWNRNGARYVWNIAVDPVAQTVSFQGQANQNIVMTWDDLFIADVTGVLDFVNVDGHAFGCLFAATCTLTTNTDTTSAIPLPSNATGSATLETRTYVGAVGTPGAGKMAYAYRVDLSHALSTAEAACVTDVAIDFGPNTRLSFDGTGQTYDAFVVNGTDVGVYSVSRTGNSVDFVFNRPVCAGSAPGGGQSSLLFGLLSTFPPRNVTAKVGWPGALSLPTPAQAPNHP